MTKVGASALGSRLFGFLYCINLSCMVLNSSFSVSIYLLYFYGLPGRFMENSVLENIIWQILS